MGTRESIRRFIRLFGRPLIIAFSLWLLMYIDPLGVEEATAEHAERTIMRIAAPLYHGSNEVSVVLIDQDYVQRSGGAWPLTYAQQGLLLRRITGHDPKAVFIDLLYKNQHVASVSDQDKPSELLGAVEGTLVPIYVAGVPNEGALVGWECEKSRSVRLDDQSILQDIHDNKLITGKGAHDAGADHIAMVSWSGCEEQYPFMLGNDANAPTPAYALYREYCEPAVKGVVARLGRLNAPCGLKPEPHPAPMTVRWGAYPPASQEPFYESGICQHKNDSAGVVPRLITTVEQFFLSFVGNIRASDDPDQALPCPSVNVIPASLLLDPDNFGPLDNVFKGHFVFIGARIPGVPDSVVSPVHGQIPGVVLHAMALDNLIALQGRYLKRLPKEVAAGLSLFFLCAVALASIRKYPRLEHLSRPNGWCSRACQMLWVVAATFAFIREDLLKSIALLAGGLLSMWLAPRETINVLAFFIGVCVSSVLMVVLGYTPTNWIALAVAATATHAAVKHEVLNEQFERLQKWLDARIFVAMATSGRSVWQSLQPSSRRER